VPTDDQQKGFKISSPAIRGFGSESWMSSIVVLRIGNQRAAARKLGELVLYPSTLD
jgi:hypothetical protein